MASELNAKQVRVRVLRCHGLVVDKADEANEIDMTSNVH